MEGEEASAGLKREVYKIVGYEDKAMQNTCEFKNEKQSLMAVLNQLNLIERKTLSAQQELGLAVFYEETDKSAESLHRVLTAAYRTSVDMAAEAIRLASTIQQAIMQSERLRELDCPGTEQQREKNT